MDVAKVLRDTLIRRGAALVGFADLGELPAGARLNLPRGVAVAVALDPRIIAGITDGPTDAYYDEYLRVNAKLNELATGAAGWLREKGFKAEAVPATLDVIDRKTLWTPLPHKTVATRAGLGWIGRCALLINESFGSAIRMATVLTDLDLPTGEPINEGRCGECRACVEICPGGAPSGLTWRAGMTRSEFFDAFACGQAAADQARARGFAHMICGRCIVACPWTRKYLSRAGLAGQPSGKND